MNEDALFDLVNEAVMYAKEQIEKEELLDPFAMVLYEKGAIESLNTDKRNDHDMMYEELVGSLREKTDKEDEIEALVIVSRVIIPETYQAEVQSGIRVHLEERSKQGNKIGARFLYVPYQLYRDSATKTFSMQLFTPIPVAFPPEIFK